MSLEACPPGRPVEMTFEIGELVSRIARALEILDRNTPGAPVLVEHVHREAVEIYPVLRTAFHMLPTGPGACLKGNLEELPNGAMPSVGVPLDEKARWLRHMLAFMSGLPAVVRLSITGDPNGVEVSVALEGGEMPTSVSRRFGIYEVPWFARDILRRRTATTGPPGSAVVKCPHCFSGVMPQKGKLWGWWCPTCGARLVLE
jgi:hypothetical protein